MKKYNLFILVALTLLFSCKKDEDNSVQSITVHSVSDTVKIYHGTLQMLAVVFPSDAADTSVTWSVDNASATIDATGLLTAAGNGKVVVTAMANDGSGVFGTDTIVLINQSPLTSATVSLGANSINDVYYSLSTGIVKTASSTLWDIAFSVPLQTATIIINEGAGVELYCVGDTTMWSTVNASSITSHEARYNDKSNWMKGAFNQNNIDPFNFGWGTYIMSSHNVIGDSIYIIRLTDGSLKKFAIRQRIGATDTYVLRWSDPDGSNEKISTFSPASYSAKHFIHYSIADQQVVEVEPEKGAWDLLFTTYVAKIPTGPSTYMNYPVMGVLANKDLQLTKVTGIDPETALLSDTSNTFSSQSDLIGWDWKVNDPVTHLYSIAENTCYFIKQSGGQVYKIYFTGYSGSASGEVTFKTLLIE